MGIPLSLGGLRFWRATWQLALRISKMVISFNLLILILGLCSEKMIRGSHTDLYTRMIITALLMEGEGETV